MNGVRALLALIAAAAMFVSAAAGPTKMPVAAATPVDCAPSDYQRKRGGLQPAGAVGSVTIDTAVAHATGLSGASAYLGAVQLPPPSPASEIRLLDSWQPDQAQMILSAWSRYERLIGEARMRQLVQTALRLGSRNWAQLCFARGTGTGVPAAYWAPGLGQIVLNDSLFDPTLLREKYAWTAFLAWRNTASEMVTIQDAIIAHEIGHVLYDALEAEQQALDPYGDTLGSLYRAYVDPRYWPHYDVRLEENLATELALLSLGITRPGGVIPFDHEVMLPALAGTYWPTDSTLRAASARVMQAPR